MPNLALLFHAAKDTVEEVVASLGGGARRRRRRKPQVLHGRHEATVTITPRIHSPTIHGQSHPAEVTIVGRIRAAVALPSPAVLRREDEDLLPLLMALLRRRGER